MLPFSWMLRANRWFYAAQCFMFRTRPPNSERLAEGQLTGGAHHVLTAARPWAWPVTCQVESADEFGVFLAAHPIFFQPASQPHNLLCDSRVPWNKPFLKVPPWKQCSSQKHHPQASKWTAITSFVLPNSRLPLLNDRSPFLEWSSVKRVMVTADGWGGSFCKASKLSDLGPVGLTCQQVLTAQGSLPRAGALWFWHGRWESNIIADNEMGNPGIVPLHVPGSESMQKIRGVAKLAQWLAHLL